MKKEATVYKHSGWMNRWMFILISGWMMLAGYAYAEEDRDPHRTGALPPSAEEKAWMEQHALRVRKVKLNKLGLERVNQHREKQGGKKIQRKAAPVGREIEGVKGTVDGEGIETVDAVAAAAASDVSTTEVYASEVAASASLPTYVDNSTLKYFPPVRSQGNLGSCAQFSSVYYTLTHMTAMARGWNAKTGGTAYQFSPKFTYNMVNDGSDSGSWFVFSMMTRHGCTLWSEFPYDSNFREWCLDSDAWRNALNYRADETWTVKGLDAAATHSESLEDVKALLSNGYVMNYNTYVNSWGWKTLSNDPGTNADDAFVGKAVADRVNGTEGPHSMTVVGYNDDVWCDVNANGVVDAGEKGALRICNSWGTSWKEGGKCWLLYDALRTTSIIPNAPVRSGKIFWSGAVYGVTARADYTPRVLGRLTLNHKKRNQIYLYWRVNGVTVLSSMLKANGGAYAFDGTTTACDGVFYFDLSDGAPADLGSEADYSVFMQDGAEGDELAVKDFSVVDCERELTRSCPDTPDTIDNKSVLYTATYQQPEGSVALDQTVWVDPDMAAAITLTANSPAGFDPPAYTVVSQPANGTLSGNAPDLIYTPNAGFSESDSFTFTVNDGAGDSDPATVSVIMKGLLADWKLDDGSSTVVSDSSGKGFDAAMSGATWVSGTDGGALDFNGSSSTVTLPASAFASIDNEITVSMWVYGGDNQPRNDSIFYAVNSSSARVLNVHLPWSDGGVYWDAGNDGGYDRINKTALPADYKGQWNHWAFTKNAASGTMAIYLNGALWHSGTGMTKAMSGITAAALGSQISGMNYAGMIDEVRLYNYALSDSEVAALFNGPSPYSTWTAEYGLTGDDALIGADVEDGGIGDGYTNLQEFALGMDPTIWDAGSRESHGVVDDGGMSYFEYMYHRRTDYLGRGLSYDVLDSTTLLDSGDSVNAQDEVIVGPAVDGYEPVYNRYLLDGTPAKFFQLRIQQD